MNVLVFNCGSSSLKYRLIALPQEKQLASGEAQRIGAPTAEPSRVLHRVGAGASRVVAVPMANHGDAFDVVMGLLGEERALMPDAIGHRIAHGGPAFDRHVVIDETVLAKLHGIGHLAPLHNPPAVALIEACWRRYPQLPQTAVFDTVFHRSIPPRASIYALPADLREGLGLHKYGFHGTSHEYVAGEAARLLDLPLSRLNAVSCHLGSGGASLCAIVAGRSVDNTMGYSTLPGLVMSTRCGDLDPALVLGALADSQGRPAEVEGLLSRRSGVLGLSGRSADIRDLIAPREATWGLEDRRDDTWQVYLWRIRKYLGAYLAVVGRTDAIIFTDTIGETVPEVRWAVCSGLDVFGLDIDAGRNGSAEPLPIDVATTRSAIRILVIATNEEVAIARYTFGLLAEPVIDLAPGTVS